MHYGFQADVLATRGRVMWSRGMGVDACELAVRYIATQVEGRQHEHEHDHDTAPQQAEARATTPQQARATIVDPFCGHGTVLAVGNRRGFHTVGVERAKKRCKTAAFLLL